ncbi:hypothetical protein BC941DRAFT_5949 [Chlamydoabsidia padenii]|nr:hypothetical protein BC941DRAFT_5949 [Chlamydoabsidia padenii]
MGSRGLNLHERCRLTDLIRLFFFFYLDLVLSKCKNHLEDGARLENLSWRLWHQKQPHHSVQPILSLSGGDDCHEVPQEKQTQHDHVPEEKKDFAFSTKANNASPTHSNPDNAPRQTSRTTTPSLSDSYQQEDDDDDDDYLYDDEYDDDDDIYDDDDLYDDDDNYIYEEEEESKFMHRRRLDKLRSSPNQHYFQKTSPQPLTKQPSLLSALFKTPPNSSSSSVSITTCRYNPSSSNDRVQPNAPDHFLKKEWTESLRKNVLWEHVQQKPFYTNCRSQHSSSYYHHPPPPSSSYQPPANRYHQQHQHHQNTNSTNNNNNNNNNINNNRPPSKKTIFPSDQGWLESFHGW